MKPMGDGFILKSKTVTPVECLHYAMTLPTSTVITGIDSLEILKQDLEAVKTLQAPDGGADRRPAPEDGRRRPPRAASSRSRRPTGSTGRPSTPSGWGRPIQAPDRGGFHTNPDGKRAALARPAMERIILR